MMFPGLRWISAGTSSFLDLLYPVFCAGCEGDVESGEVLCHHCQGESAEIAAPFCEVCSQPYDGAIDGPFSCSNCLGDAFDFECAVSPYRSRGPVREMIHRFKYDRQYHLRRPLGVLLCRTMDDERIRRQPADALVPVPLHPRRERDRGFNQAEALCQVLGGHTGLPVWPALRRVRFTETQTHFAREERRHNLRDAFTIHPRRTVTGKHLLLVDDVFTTGSTVQECAKVLRRAGAASVRVVTVARA